jgi:hypothetical protein
MEQLAVLTSTRVRPEDKLIFAALERRGIPFITLAIDPAESPDGCLAVTEISHAMKLNGLFNGAETEIADGIADYAGDVLRQ